MNIDRLIFNADLFRQFDASILIGNHNVCPPDWGEKNCKYTYNKMYYFQEGDCTIQIGDSVFHPKPYDLFLIPANVVHSYWHNPKKPVLKYWFHFSINPSVPWHINYNATSCYCYGEPKVFLPLFEAVFDTFGSTSPLRILEQKYLLIKIFKEYLERTDLKKVIPDVEDYFHNVVQNYIVTHLAEQITLEQLSSVTHLQKNYLIHKFKSEFGTTPIEYVSSMRLDACIKEINQNPDCTIKEVCQKYGFNDSKYFSRLFKKRFGINPTTYRNNL